MTVFKYLKSYHDEKESIYTEMGSEDKTRPIDRIYSKLFQFNAKIMKDCSLVYRQFHLNVRKHFLKEQNKKQNSKTKTTSRFPVF